MGLIQIHHKIKSILGLGFSLAKAGFKVKNERSYLGVLWYLLEPLALFTIIILLGRILSNNSIENYPVYLLLGLIMFNFFRQTTVYSSFAITSSEFIKSIKINYESLIVSEMFISVFSHVFEIIVLTIFVFIFKIPVYRILFYFPIFLIYLVFTFGFCFILAVVGTHIRDFKNVWSVIMNVLWFATPIFYVIPKGKEVFISKLNIIGSFIEISRNLIIYNISPSFWKIILIILASIVSFAIGLFVFEKNKKKFAELV